MKQYLSLMIIFAVMMTILPAVSLLFPKQESNLSPSVSETESNPVSRLSAIIPSEDTPADTTSEDVFLVLDIESGKVLEVPAEKYIIGAVCAEMPASFEPEALKAQAVAAHTYAVRQREKERINPTPSLNGAYFSNDSRYFQAYFTEEQARKFYGESYDENYGKISDAVKDVLDEIIVYNNEPIVAAFHSMSGGMTESAEVIWGNPIDYLVPVESRTDTEAAAFEEEYKFTPAEIKSRVSEAYGVKFGNNMKNWFSVTERSPSGTVTEMIAGDGTITGMQLREALSIRSANLTIEYDGESFIITTKGYGHGVGMSQYGANAMAQNGYTYADILAYYYPETEIITDA